MAKTKADLERRIATLEAMMRRLIASHKDYTESHARNKERPNSGWPALEWALVIEETAEGILSDRS